VLDKRPDPDAQLTESLEAIRRTSKDALAELRTTIGVFRDPDGGAPHGPRPGLDRLDDLVAALVNAGREVRVVRDPPLQPALPAAVDQAAFRIVQEALTNVVRHAGSSAAEVLINRSPDELIIEVSDAGPATHLPVAGNGIAGMVERARAVGGRVGFEAIAPHGLRVRGVLPVVEGA
jgi:signal transduction histidine kinase